MSKTAAFMVGALLFSLAYFFNFSYFPQQIFAALSGKTPIEVPDQDHKDNRIQIALLLDTSNSMDGLIEQAKSQLWKMVNELADTQKEGQAPKVEIALYEYGNSQLNARKGYIRAVVPMTNDIDLISKQLFALSTNGGEEYCGWVIKDALGDLDWSVHQEDLKIIVIAGNEAFHQGPVNFKTVCKTAAERGILINTIHCGDYQEGIELQWAAGAKCAGGQYMNINQDDKVVHIPTPYDQQIIDLNNQLNKTYIGYGALGKTNTANQVAQDLNASAYGSSNLRERASFKSKKAYNNASWDLVDAAEKNTSIIDELEDEALPEEMKGLSEEERKTYIDQKRKEREEISQQIKQLNEKAEAFIAKERKAQAGQKTLDEVLLKLVSEQARAKGYVKQ